MVDLRAAHVGPAPPPASHPLWPPPRGTGISGSADAAPCCRGASGAQLSRLGPLQTRTALADATAALVAPDPKILSECQRKVPPGGPHRVSHTRTSLTWSMLTDSTFSAGIGNPQLHPGPWSLCRTEPGSTVAATRSWLGCW